MHNCSISLENFRNFESFYLDFPLERITILYGENGSGKTSILEALFYLFYGTSFREKNLHHLINSNANYFKVRFNVGNVHFFSFLDVYGNKKVTLNDEIVNRHLLRNYFLPVYSIGKENLIDGSYSERRKILDKLASFTQQGIKKTLSDYEKIAKDKKEAILRKDRFTLSAINEKFYELYIKVFNARKGILQKLSTLAKNLGINQFEFSIEPSILNFSDLSDIIEREMEEERLLKGTSFDIVNIKLNGFDARKYLSHGEKQFFWNLLFFNFIEDYALSSGRRILMLMDEMFSVLDEEKVRKLIEGLQEKRGKVFYFFTSQREIRGGVYHIYLKKEYGRVKRYN